MQFGTNIVLSNKLCLRFDPLNYARLGDVKYSFNKFCVGLTFCALYNFAIFYACFIKQDNIKKLTLCKLCVPHKF
jgi:hypothetical protein